jgi:hypothetical protein
VTTFGKWKLQHVGYQGKRRSAIEEHKTLREEDGPVTSILMSKEVEVGSSVRFLFEAFAYRIESKSLDVLLVDCRSVYNKAQKSGI